MEKINTKFKTVAVAAAKRAGIMLVKEFERFDRQQIAFKSQHEVVTKFDTASERIIRQEITKAFPDHGILGEEEGADESRSDYLWIIDPIDGTTNFTFHNPLWSISIALAYQGQPIVGVVYLPVMNEMFVAVKHQGATRNGKKIRVSDLRGNRSIHTFCHGYMENDIKLALKYYQKQKQSQFDCRQLGSAALELAYVASGRVDSLMIPGAKPWDIAAGILLVREAGGQVTDLAGKPWQLSDRSVLATNTLQHNDILKLIKSL
ncbi:inositol monophosphatase [Candidatus Falkowbacteria bacterium]|nr:inositol monophosphatase [Candidatus Falkowbacteria bacterium]